MDRIFRILLLVLSLYVALRFVAACVLPEQENKAIIECEHQSDYWLHKPNTEDTLITNNQL